MQYRWFIFNTNFILIDIAGNGPPSRIFPLRRAIIIIIIAIICIYLCTTALQYHVYIFLFEVKWAFKMKLISLLLFLVGEFFFSSSMPLPTHRHLILLTLQSNCFQWWAIGIVIYIRVGTIVVYSFAVNFLSEYGLSFLISRGRTPHSKSSFDC